ncbi:DUF4832 domain-containing protein [Cellulomonas pakistanensis]|uniref:DUF4832 domain-containing protein n=1 Tax=Cellulomonas pakistanensis TaxID=992287 RepID=A0A919P8D0_9CELL|nr:DUF4832 domain-containing protein [Cellulomonas pakistanensis]GIG36240.1 hypothetical protein Cpa01nite_16210 [Cellulomonas pakistanensis]
MRVAQDLDYTEDPVDVPNPDRGAYRGRWQWVPTRFGATPEVDRRVPRAPRTGGYQGATLVAPGVVGVVDGDDLEPTEFFDGTDRSPHYVGGTGVVAEPAVAFLGFDLCEFSSNAFLTRAGGRAFDAERAAAGGVATPEMFRGRTGRTGPLTSYALDVVRGALRRVREGEGTALVKFSYDGNGFAFLEGGPDEHLIWAPEPTQVTANNPSAACDVPGHTEKSWIEYHLWQLAPVLHEFEDVITCVKTGMLGPWGEQHSSPQAQDPAAYVALLDACLAAVPASRPLLTHVGGYLAWHNATHGTRLTFGHLDALPAPAPGTPEARFGFFHDSYAAGWSEDGWTDHGSLAEGSGMLVAPGAPTGFDRDSVTAWVGRQGSVVQGEGGLAPNVCSRLPGAILEAQRLGTTLLNLRHGDYRTWNDVRYTEDLVTAPVTLPGPGDGADPPYTGRTARAVFDPVYAGRTGLEYLRDRLGYRLLLRSSEVSDVVDARTGVLALAGHVQNVGFGPVVNAKQVRVLLRAVGGAARFAAPTDLDVRAWRPAADGDNRPGNTTAWHAFAVEVPMSGFGEVPAGKYDVLLRIADPKETSDRRRGVRFANRGTWVAELGANRVGRVVVR